MGETLAAFSFFMPGQTPEDAKCMREWISPEPARETLIKSLSDFILGVLYRARRQRARIASYLRRMSTTLCIKSHMKSDSAIESAFP